MQSILDEWINRVYRPDIRPGDENSKFRIPVTAIAGLQDNLVTPASARSVFQDPPAEVVSGTHTSMKEPVSRDALSYRIVQGAIKATELPAPPVRSTTADLNITPLTSGRALMLDGHKVKVSAEKTVFTGGARVSFTLSHNKRAQDSIVLKSTELVVHRFEKAVRTDLAYTVSADDVKGAGTMARHKFVVTVRDGKVAPAKWLLTDPGDRVVTARSENFFDYEGVKYLALRADTDDVEEVEGTIIAKGLGLYEVAFVFRYSVAGQDRVKETERLLIYRKD